ncbi:MAG: EAL domain-containing protein [Clostridia bacterium]
MKQVLAGYYKELLLILDNSIKTKIALQPIFNLSTGALYGYEALARWNSLNPENIFQTASKTNLIIDLEKEILKAIIQIIPFISDKLFINVYPTLPDANMWHCLKNENVVLEITEAANINFQGISQLRNLGFVLGLYDIGKGSATLDNLAKLQPDFLKIDKSLTQSKNVFARNSLIKAFVDHSIRLNSKIVLEGIETKEQYLAAKKCGAHYGQGYYLAEPQIFDPEKDLLKRENFNHLK